MIKKVIYALVAVVVVIAVAIAGSRFFESAQKNKTLDEMTVHTGRMLSGRSLMCDLKFSHVSFKTANEKVAQVTHGKVNGMIMPISAGKTKIVMTGTYKKEKYTRTLPLTVKKDPQVKVGADVSAWNTDFDAAKVKKYHLDFIMLRLGVSKDVDRQSRLKAIALKKENVPMGAYWYLTSEDRRSLMTVKEAKSQAHKFVRMLNNMEGKTMAYPVFVDVESSTLVKADDSVHYMEKLIKAFTDVLHQAGYQNIGLYANRAFLVNYLSSDYFKSFDKIWYARYGYAKGGPYADGGHAYMWQTGDRYRSQVVNGHDLDLDYHYEN